ncbi:hypothetical protein Leryth_013193 [Lithospermum erythrorhizon]|nr:hypothetical protein Leryth_013193 [Lithospermum erythrorhizon]
MLTGGGYCNSKTFCLWRQHPPQHFSSALQRCLERLVRYFEKSGCKITKGPSIHHACIFLIVRPNTLLVSTPHDFCPDLIVRHVTLLTSKFRETKIELALPFCYTIMKCPHLDFLFLAITYFSSRMRYGFAFVYMEDERDAEDAIRGLDRYEFGRKGRRLRVEWTKQERGSSRRIESSRRPAANTRPSKTLFVINFDPFHTRTADLERHFDPYGKILNIRIRKNFAFIHYESLEDATRALDATNYSKLMDRVITVEYAIRDDDDKGNGHSPHRSIDRSPRRDGYNRGRSPSPYGRQRGSSLRREAPRLKKGKGRYSPAMVSASPEEALYSVSMIKPPERLFYSFISTSAKP